MDDMTPLPPWRQRVAQIRFWWRIRRDRRRAAWKILGFAASKGLTLAIPVVGAILISYGVWCVYRPAGFVVGGLMCWLLTWSNEQDRRRE